MVPNGEEEEAPKIEGAAELALGVAAEDCANANGEGVDAT